MSGPIVRKYGFPNFEQIFGKREPQHGVESPHPDPKDQAPGGQTPPDPKPTEEPRPAQGT
jgi:hypothetical protein